jgi:hypothetical protein
VLLTPVLSGVLRLLAATLLAFAQVHRD